MEKKYSVLTYIIGNYEKVHEIKEKSPNAEYILVTDNKELTSSTWNVIYVDNPHPEDNFDLCYQIRFNPFDYVHTDICARIDGSIGINKNLDNIVDYFNINQYDICLLIHPLRNNMINEYAEWVKYRGYGFERAKEMVTFLFEKMQYDFGYKGLYQYNFMIHRKNKVNEDINRMTYSLIKYLAPEGKQIERLDQTIGSAVLNRFFCDKIKVLPVSQKLCSDGNFMNMYFHNSDEAYNDDFNYIEPFLFNNKVDVVEF